jgi:hypothetical protein
VLLLGVQRLVVSPGVSGRFRVKAAPPLASLPGKPMEVAPGEP